MEKISAYLTDWLSEGLPFGERQRLKLQLGIELVLHNILMTGSLLVLARLAGTFWETVLFFCVFGSIRCFAGGFHFNSSGACLAGTGIMVFAACWLAGSLPMGEMQKGLAVLACVLVLLAAAPQGTRQNPIVKGSYKYPAVLLAAFWYVLGQTALERYGSLIVTALVFQTLSLLVQMFRNQAAA